MGKYRKRPIEIEAVQWTGDNVDEVLALVPLAKDGEFDLPNDDMYVKPGIGHMPSQGKLYIPTLEGTMTANLGDWIIRGVKGELYPCKPDIFEQTYEAV